MKKFTEWLQLNNLHLFNEQDPTSVFNQSMKYNRIRTPSKMAEPTESELDSHLKDPRYSTIPNYSKESSPMSLMGTGGRSQVYNPKLYSTAEIKPASNKNQLDLMIPNFTGPSTSELIQSLNANRDKTNTYVTKTRTIRK